MKKKYLILVTAVLAVAGFSLTACSNANSTSSISSSQTTSSSSENNKPVGIYQHFQEAKDELWYNIYPRGAFSKTSRVSYIAKVTKGKATIYLLPEEVTIGDLSKMTDDEINDKLSEWNSTARESRLSQIKSKLSTAQKQYDQQVSGTTDPSNDDLENPDTLAKDIETYKSQIADEEKYKSSGETVTIKAKVTTDSTGNNTDYETIELGSDSLRFDGNISNQIFKSKYVGLCHYSQNSDESSRTDASDILVTRSDLVLNFDSPETKGVDVD